ncbi:hypothetical protein E1B28_007533 [Marasmius oreades]|uniref:Uncharacterized protein n=1 Tax=Marasmius oreades TaxID=181124 RepID=A0A9P7S2J0_9AGAR|nr:uncharacterized protein E1B28_007533 [Marasmius oreades]KAG7093895.1 hypothetical protein E1B28_007533 [Marasmius oreades]
MCQSCREKHRRYATTKRAKRKLEKAALQGQTLIAFEQISGSSLLSESTTERSSSPGSQSKSATLDVQSHSSPESATSTQTPSVTKPSYSKNSIQPPSTLLPLPGTTWDISNIDPRMFEAQPGSSELAGALTPLPRSTLPQSAMTSTPQFDFQTPTVLSASPEATQDPTDDTQSAGVSSSGTRRFCSIKGCKSILAGDYNYKMCNPCRDRYKNYGVTKRAKWKAERIAFDQELENLKRVEDERRAKAGLGRLSASPEELRAWELSIIDEKVALPPTLANVLSSVASNAIVSSSPYALSLAQILAPLDQLDSTQAARLAHLMRIKFESKTDGLPGASLVAGERSMSEGAQVSEAQNALAISSSQNEAESDSCASNEQGASGISSSTLPAALVLHQRMCTVSHCHTILPGHCLYKRCDHHRYQNRKHGKLKRVREKTIKGKGVDPVEDGGEEEVIDTDTILQANSDPFDSETVEKRKIETKARERAKQLILTRNLPGVKRTKASTPQVKVDKSNKGDKANAAEGEVEDAGGSITISSVTPAQIIEPRACGSNHLVNEKRKAFSCTARNCSNLINPCLRWRMCETCRAVRKELRLGQLELERQSESHEDDRLLAREEDPGQVSDNPESFSVEDLERNRANRNKTLGDSLGEPAELSDRHHDALTIKAFTPKEVRATQQDQGPLFGVLHESRPAEDERDDFIVANGSQATGIDDAAITSQDVNPEKEDADTGCRQSLPVPVPTFSPTIPRPAEFVYKAEDWPKRKLTSPSSSTSPTTIVKPSDAGPAAINEPVRKRRRLRTVKTLANIPNELAGQSTSSSRSSTFSVAAPHGHISHGGYYPYMTYSHSPPFTRSYSYPPGTSIAVPYPYPYAYPGYGYPGYPYPSYPFGGSSHSYPYAVPPPPQPPYPYNLAHTHPPPLLTPLPAPSSPIERADNSSRVDRTGGQQIEDSKSVKQMSGIEEDETTAKVSEQREISTTTKDVPSVSTSNPSPKKYNFVSPMVANPVSSQSENAPKRSRDIFTNYTPQTVQDGSVKKRRSTPLFQANAQDRLKQIQASLALSKPRNDSKGVFVTMADEVPSSASAGSSKVRGSFRYMFYQPPADSATSQSVIPSSDGPITSDATETQSEPPVPEDGERYEEATDPVPAEQSGTVGDQNEGDKRFTQAQGTPSRWCKNKACNRVISNHSSGWLCDRCKTKIKHHQAKTKLRFKLEPVKKVAPTKGNIKKAR